MSAIPAASVNLKTMADGTLRITFDIEPGQVQDAFRLFAAPGTPVAIAALKTGYAAKSGEPDPQLNPLIKEGVGPLCKWVVMRCQETEFWAWLNAEFWPRGELVTSADQASGRVKSFLQVESRKEIDGDPVLEEIFHKRIRQPYQKWLQRRRG